MHLVRAALIGGLVGLIAVGALATVAAEGAWDRVRTRPIDLTEVEHHLGFHAPYSVTSFVKRDGIAFRAHALLATVIARFNGAPSAVATQWFKAAAHARTDSELQRYPGTGVGSTA